MQHETDASVEEQIDELHELTTIQLVQRFAELHGHETKTRHRTDLFRKHEWRIQARARGHGVRPKPRQDLIEEIDTFVYPPPGPDPPL